MTTETDFKAHLHTIDPDGWDKFFGLIPEIERTHRFSLSSEIDRLTGPTPLKVVQDFLYLFHELDLKVVFGWSNWTEGHNILNQAEFDFDNLETYTLCKLLTTIVRADRFNEGFLIARFEDGTVLRILRAIRNDQKTNELSAY